jgi:hypothetical protein
MALMQQEYPVTIPTSILDQQRLCKDIGNCSKLLEVTIKPPADFSEISMHVSSSNAGKSWPYSRIQQIREAARCLCQFLGASWSGRDCKHCTALRLTAYPTSSETSRTGCDSRFDLLLSTHNSNESQESKFVAGICNP